MEGVKEFTEEEYNKEIQKGNWVVDFWAPWCGPCRMMAPYFAEAAGKNKDVKFGKIDVQKYPAIAQKLAIMSIPCLIYFKDGKEIHKTIGLLKTDQILENVELAFS
jgi:thioredoxin 1